MDRGHNEFRRIYVNESSSSLNKLESRTLYVSSLQWPTVGNYCSPEWTKFCKFVEQPKYKTKESLNKNPRSEAHIQFKASIASSELSSNWLQYSWLADYAPALSCKLLEWSVSRTKCQFQMVEWARPRMVPAQETGPELDTSYRLQPPSRPPHRKDGAGRAPRKHTS